MLPEIVPPTRVQEPVVASNARPPVKVPVRLTVPPVRLNSVGWVKFPPRFMVPAETAIVPVLLQVPLPLPMVIVPPATSVWMVPWFTILPLAFWLFNKPDLPRITTLGAIVSVPAAPLPLLKLISWLPVLPPKTTIALPNKDPAVAVLLPM